LNNFIEAHGNDNDKGMKTRLYPPSKTTIKVDWAHAASSCWTVPVL